MVTNCNIVILRRQNAAAENSDEIGRCHPEIIGVLGPRLLFYRIAGIKEGVLVLAIFS
jgi:hypothetical protein